MPKLLYFHFMILFDILSTMNQEERLVPPPSLGENLRPVLTYLRTENHKRKTNYAFITDWFSHHEEDLARDIADLTFLCTLPWKERSLLTYPVIGNWVLTRMDMFKPETDYQKEGFTLLRNLVAEGRFNNQQMEGLYPDVEGYAKKEDALASHMLKNPEQSLPLHELLTSISKEMANSVYGGKLPKRNDYETDLGHGLWAPVNHFQFLTNNFGVLVERNQTQPLNLSVMVVDDEHPEEWYERMIAIGFKDQPELQGFFPDCESALEALKIGSYDVILTDLDLGEGKMNGVEFAKLAYAIQTARGNMPMISTFSANKEGLKRADRELRIDRLGREEPSIVFGDISLNYKGFFTAIDFRRDVSTLLHRQTMDNNS